MASSSSREPDRKALVGAAKGLLAIAAPEVGIPVEAASAAAGAAERILTGDIAVVRFQGEKRGTKKEPLPPRDYEIHVNAVSAGLGILALAAAGLVGSIAWNGLTTGGIWSRSPIGIFPGLKDTRTFGPLPDKLRADWARARQKP